ncbi:MAG: polysaccharide biosynthesis/export family protein [Muribaculaceae bacterium]|nr:polysaccharide biosynthesis/export family protein [Muribaculaceae bacterium]MBR1475391.1 polysaccharide biosynthesis/export family protein [Muribaculaceae bacterium]MBR1725242.1 polysaccharide biosynthesis/export family protein [Muribaculaceae bacterium]
MVPNRDSVVRLLPGVAMVVLMVVVASCTTIKDNNLAYFKNLPDATSGQLATTTPQQVRLQVDDEIAVTITSGAPEATAVFNAPLANSSVRGDVAVQGNPKLMSHIVDREGNIELPVLGKINVLGKTVNEVEQLIGNRVAATVRDPYVNVQLLSFYVNVMGEVKEPQRIKVDKQQFSVLDALASCGDLTEYGQRDGVVVIRNDGTQTTYHQLNLADTGLFSSPYFYLQQNDVVYVAPNRIRIDNSKYNQNNAYKLSVISTIVSAVSVVASLVIALAIK